MVQKKFIGRASGVRVTSEKAKSRLGSRGGFPADIVSGRDRSVLFFPCAGNGNGTSLNNRGANGNYWSASWNSVTNARNLNFNSGGVNPQNNNNRFIGRSVRAVQHSL